MKDIRNLQSIADRLQHFAYCVIVGSQPKQFQAAVVSAGWVATQHAVFPGDLPDRDVTTQSTKNPTLAV